MIINKPGSKFVYEGNTYAVGDQIIGTEESEYVGLYGSILEIRDGEDKDTENETPDIYCCFDAPVLPSDVKKLEERFSNLYDEPKTVEDICLDEIIMAPSMIRVLGNATDGVTITAYRVVEDWAVDEVSGCSETPFTDLDHARLCFNRKLSDEINDGGVLRLRAMDGFTEEEAEFQYCAFVNGEYGINHYDIKIIASELRIGTALMQEIGRAYSDAVHRERFLIAATQEENAENLTEEQFEQMLRDPEIPALIRAKLDTGKTYDSEYLDAVNKVVCDLIQKYSEACDYA